MSNRKYSETSKAAYDSLKMSDISAIHQMILNALKVLGIAHTERIAEYLTMPHPKIHKRISELAALGLVWKPGGKLPMKSGRNAYLWQLTDAANHKTDKEVKYQSNIANAADYAAKILNNTIPVSTQPKLFE